MSKIKLLPNLLILKQSDFTTYDAPSLNLVCSDMKRIGFFSYRTQSFFKDYDKKEFKMFEDSDLTKDKSEDQIVIDYFKQENFLDSPSGYVLVECTDKIIHPRDDFQVLHYNVFDSRTILICSGYVDFIKDDIVVKTYEDVFENSLEILKLIYRTNNDYVAEHRHKKYVDFLRSTKTITIYNFYIFKNRYGKTTPSTTSTYQPNYQTGKKFINGKEIEKNCEY